MEVLVKDVVSEGAEQLKQVGIADYQTDSWLLAEEILGVRRQDIWLIPNQSVDITLVQKYEEAVKRRATHVPLQHITGHQPFMDFDFMVNRDVLIPRSETELLVEQVVSYIQSNFPDKNKTVKVLDMCTGSGCIAISVDKMCDNAKVRAVDISEKALQVARENNIKNQANVTFIQSDLFENVTDKFDVIVSNPPYIPTEALQTLMEEVRDYDPPLALDGSEDGLKFYRIISEKAEEFLNHHGRLFLEIGHDQGKSVPELLRENGFSKIQVLKDLSGNDRMVIAGKE